MKKSSAASPFRAISHQLSVVRPNFTLSTNLLFCSQGINLEDYILAIGEERSKVFDQPHGPLELLKNRFVITTSRFEKVDQGCVSPKQAEQLFFRALEEVCAPEKILKRIQENLERRIRKVTLGCKVDASVATQTASLPTQSLLANLFRKSWLNVLCRVAFFGGILFHEIGEIIGNNGCRGSWQQLNLKEKIKAMLGGNLPQGPPTLAGIIANLIVFGLSSVLLSPYLSPFVIGLLLYLATVNLLEVCLQFINVYVWTFNSQADLYRYRQRGDITYLGCGLSVPQLFIWLSEKLSKQWAELVFGAKNLLTQLRVLITVAILGLVAYVVSGSLVPLLQGLTLTGLPEQLKTGGILYVLSSMMFWNLTTLWSLAKIQLCSRLPGKMVTLMVTMAIAISGYFLLTSPLVTSMLGTVEQTLGSSSLAASGLALLLGLSLLAITIYQFIGSMGQMGISQLKRGLRPVLAVVGVSALLVLGAQPASAATVGSTTIVNSATSLVEARFLLGGLLFKHSRSITVSGGNTNYSKHSDKYQHPYQQNINSHLYSLFSIVAIIYALIQSINPKINTLNLNVVSDWLMTIAANAMLPNSYSAVANPFLWISVSIITGLFITRFINVVKKDFRSRSVVKLKISNPAFKAGVEDCYHLPVNKILTQLIAIFTVAGIVAALVGIGAIAGAGNLPELTSLASPFATIIGGMPCTIILSLICCSLIVLLSLAKIRPCLRQLGKTGAAGIMAIGIILGYSLLTSPLVTSMLGTVEQTLGSSSLAASGLALLLGLSLLAITRFQCIGLMEGRLNKSWIGGASSPLLSKVSKYYWTTTAFVSIFLFLNLLAYTDQLRNDSNKLSYEASSGLLLGLVVWGNLPLEAKIAIFSIILAGILVLLIRQMLKSHFACVPDSKLIGRALRGTDRKNKGIEKCSGLLEWLKAGLQTCSFYLSLLSGEITHPITTHPIIQKAVRIFVGIVSFAKNSVKKATANIIWKAISEIFAKYFLLSSVSIIFIIAKIITSSFVFVKNNFRLQILITVAGIGLVLVVIGGMLAALITSRMALTSLSITAIAIGELLKKFFFMSGFLLLGAFIQNLQVLNDYILNIFSYLFKGSALVNAVRGGRTLSNIPALLSLDDYVILHSLPSFYSPFTLTITVVVIVGVICWWIYKELYLKLSLATILTTASMVGLIVADYLFDPGLFSLLHLSVAGGGAILFGAAGAVVLFLPITYMRGRGVLPTTPHPERSEGSQKILRPYGLKMTPCYSRKTPREVTYIVINGLCQSSVLTAGGVTPEQGCTGKYSKKKILRMIEKAKSERRVREPNDMEQDLLFRANKEADSLLEALVKAGKITGPPTIQAPAIKGYKIIKSSKVTFGSYIVTENNKYIFYIEEHYLKNPYIEKPHHIEPKKSTTFPLKVEVKPPVFKTKFNLIIKEGRIEEGKVGINYLESFSKLTGKQEEDFKQDIISVLTGLPNGPPNITVSCEVSSEFDWIAEVKEDLLQINPIYFNLPENTRQAIIDHELRLHIILELNEKDALRGTQFYLRVHKEALEEICEIIKEGNKYGLIAEEIFLKELKWKFFKGIWLTFRGWWESKFATAASILKGIDSALLLEDYVRACFSMIFKNSFGLMAWMGESLLAGISKMSLSLLTIYSALASAAASMNILSLESLEILTFLVGITIVVSMSSSSLKRFASSGLKYFFIRGLAIISRISSFISNEIIGVNSAFKNAWYKLRETSPLLISILIKTLVSITTFIFFIAFFSDFFTDLINFFIRDRMRIYLFSDAFHQALPAVFTGLSFEFFYKVYSFFNWQLLESFFNLFSSYFYSYSRHIFLLPGIIVIGIFVLLIFLLIKSITYIYKGVKSFWNSLVLVGTVFVVQSEGSKGFYPSAKLIANSTPVGWTWRICCAGAREINVDRWLTIIMAVGLIICLISMIFGFLRIRKRDYWIDRIDGLSLEGMKRVIKREYAQVYKYYDRLLGLVKRIPEKVKKVFNSESLSLKTSYLGLLRRIEDMLQKILQDKLVSPNTYPLVVYEKEKEKAIEEFGKDWVSGRGNTEDILKGILPKNFREEHYKVLGERLDELLTSISIKGPPDFLKKVKQILETTQFVITTNKDLLRDKQGNVCVATVNLGQKISLTYFANTVFIHPYFFDISEKDLKKENLTLEQLQLKILFHELISHIVNQEQDEIKALEDTTWFFYTRSLRKKIDAIEERIKEGIEKLDNIGKSLLKEADIKRYNGTKERNMPRINELFEEIREFIQIFFGSHTDEKFNLEDILSEISSELKLELEKIMGEKSGEEDISLKIPKHDLTLTGMPLVLKRIFYELGLNAIKYQEYKMKDGKPIEPIEIKVEINEELIVTFSNRIDSKALERITGLYGEGKVLDIGSKKVTPNPKAEERGYTSTGQGAYLYNQIVVDYTGDTRGIEYKYKYGESGGIIISACVYLPLQKHGSIDINIILAAIIHDIRGPLTSLWGTMSMLLYKAKGEKGIACFAEDIFVKIDNMAKEITTDMQELQVEVYRLSGLFHGKKVLREMKLMSLEERIKLIIGRLVPEFSTPDMISKTEQDILNRVLQSAAIKAKIEGLLKSKEEGKAQEIAKDIMVWIVKKLYQIFHGVIVRLPKSQIREVYRIKEDAFIRQQLEELLEKRKILPIIYADIDGVRASVQVAGKKGYPSIVGALIKTPQEFTKILNLYMLNLVLPIPIKVDLDKIFDKQGRVKQEGLKEYLSQLKGEGSDLKDITVHVFDRPRRRELIDALREIGVTVDTFTGGDIFIRIYCALSQKLNPKKVHTYIGLSDAWATKYVALALKILGCKDSQMKAKFASRKAKDDLGEMLSFSGEEKKAIKESEFASDSKQILKGRKKFSLRNLVPQQKVVLFVIPLNKVKLDGLELGGVQIKDKDDEIEVIALCIAQGTAEIITITYQKER